MHQDFQIFTYEVVPLFEKNTFSYNNFSILMAPLSNFYLSGSPFQRPRYGVKLFPHFMSSNVVVFIMLSLPVRP